MVYVYTKLDSDKKHVMFIISSVRSAMQFNISMVSSLFKAPRIHVCISIRVYTYRVVEFDFIPALNYQLVDSPGTPRGWNCSYTTGYHCDHLVVGQEKLA